MYREDLIREKLAKNESTAALHRSHRCRRSMVIQYSPSSCDSTGISTVQILALVAEIFCIYISKVEIRQSPQSYIMHYTLHLA